VHPDLRHTHGRPDHTQAPPPRTRRPRRVMHRRGFSRGVPLPGEIVGRTTRGLVGRAGPSLDPSDGARGVPFDPPFAGLLPPTGGAHVSVRPGPRVVRAASSARFIFVGWPAAHGCQIPMRRVRPGMRWRRLPSFAPIRGPHPSRCGGGCDPAVGFASCRVGGHFFPCIRAGTSPPGSPASGDESPLNGGAAFPYPLVGLRRPSRHDMRVRQFGVNRRRGGP
jgi:hypothetical protein